LNFSDLPEVGPIGTGPNGDNVSLIVRLDDINSVSWWFNSDPESFEASNLNPWACSDSYQGSLQWRPSPDENLVMDHGSFNSWTEITSPVYHPNPQVLSGIDLIIQENVLSSPDEGTLITATGSSNFEGVHAQASPAQPNSNLLQEPSPPLPLPPNPNSRPSMTIGAPRVSCSDTACSKSFTRDADRIRHENQVHRTQPGLHVCPIIGCPKSLGNGYSRADKVVEHLWKKHGDLGFVKG
jgi:hypothetical protein